METYEENLWSTDSRTDREEITNKHIGWDKIRHGKTKKPNLLGDMQKKNRATKFLKPKYW